MKKTIQTFVALSIIFCGMLQASENSQYKETRKLFTRLGLKYTNKLVMDEDIRDLMKTEYSKYIAQRGVNDSSSTAIKANFKVTDYLSIKKTIETTKVRKDLAVRYIDETKGYGVFATKTIPADSLIGIYTGQIKRNGNETDTHSNDNVANQDYSFPFVGAVDTQETDQEVHILQPYKVDASTHGNTTRFINHSERNNCNTLTMFDENKTPVTVFVSRGDIQQSQELTINYGGSYNWNKQTNKLINKPIISK